MPALNFPSSPTLGQVFAAANKSWTWDGAKWIITQYDNEINDDVTQYIDDQRDSAVAQSNSYTDQQINDAFALTIALS